MKRESPPSKRSVRWRSSNIITILSMIQFDFESIKSRILNTLSSKSEWAEFLSYGTNSLLLDAIVQELVYEIQYKEYLTYENWWSLARNKSSLLVIAPIHGYKVPRKIGANGYVKVSVDKNFNNSHTRDIFIPKFFQFSNGETFVCATTLVRLPAGQNYVEIPVKQGKYKEIKFLAKGDTFEIYDILDDSVENSLYELYVNNLLWEPVNNLFEYKENDRVYEINTSPDFKKVTLRFGNNIFGKKLETNDEVVFKYISTLGDKGNIVSANNITTVESQAYDDLVNSIDLYVTNEKPILGGSGYPDIEMIRSSSPKVFQAGDRASTREDYEVILTKLDFISKATVWGVYEYNIDRGEDPWTFVPNEENVVHIAILNTNYENITEIEKNQIVQAIYPKISPTDILKFEEVEIVNLFFDVKAVVANSSYSLEGVKSTIELALKNNFSVANMNFNQNIYASDLFRFIDELEGVRNHVTKIYIEKVFYFSSAYVASTQLPLYPVSANNSEILIKPLGADDSEYEPLAYLDANGNILSVKDPETLENIYNLSGSGVSMSTGSLLLLVQNGLTGNFVNYELKIRYSLVSDDIILKRRQQILNYNSSNIIMSYPF